MSVKVTNDQEYFIVAKHSKKALGVANANVPNGLKQYDFSWANQHLKFKLDYGQHFFWLTLPPYRQRYLAVNSASTADGASVIQWNWEPNRSNLWFRFVPAGDGYYRIMAVHSNKFLDVYGAVKESGADVVQHKFMPSDNQLFKLLPVPKKTIAQSPVSYVEASNITRDAIMGLAGLTPEVGGGLKFLVGLFWTEPNKLGDLWNQMKAYVDVRIRQLILEQKLIDLDDTVKGIMNTVQKINGYTSQKKKASELPGVINNISVLQEGFLNKSIEVLPYTVALGTIMITLLHTMYADLERMTGETVSADDKRENKEALQAAIRSYTESVEKSRKELIDWRMAKVKNASTTSASLSSPTDFPGTTRVMSASSASDEYDGWSMGYTFIVTETIFKKDTEGYHDHWVRADFAAKQRKKQVEVQYALEVEEMLRPAKFWKYLDPDVPKYVPAITRKTVGTFGVVYAHNPFMGRANSGITTITLHGWAGGNMCGIEVTYGGMSNGLQGRTGNERSTLTLASGEYINSVYGFAKDIIEAVWMTTNLGNIISAGTMNNRDSRNSFCADLPDSFNARLARIDGSHNREYLEQLSFEWQYED